MSASPRLDLRHLQMILAIARHGRVSDAAQALGLTPSALSHRIREAERRLDVVLFTRLQKRLRMTPAAELLAEVAQSVLGDIARAEADVRRMDRGVAHVVRLAVAGYGAYHWLPGYLARLAVEAPDTDLQITAIGARDPAAVLAARDVDLVVAAEAPGHAGLSQLPLFEDELMFIMAPGHRLAGRDVVTGPDIVGEAFVTTSTTPAPDREFARLFRPSDSYPRWTATVEAPEAIIEMVAAGQGTSVLAGWAVRPAIKAGRIRGARVGGEGISVAWQALLRSEDARSGPIARAARTLSDWTAAQGGFG